MKVYIALAVAGQTNPRNPQPITTSCVQVGDADLATYAAAEVAEHYMAQQYLGSSFHWNLEQHWERCG